jgi:copper(I)-binding protein
MLVGLKQPLIEEALFPLTLIFEKAGRIDIEVYVEGSGPTPEHTPSH